MGIDKMFAWTTPWRKPRTATTRRSSRRIHGRIAQVAEGLLRLHAENRADRSRNLEDQAHDDREEPPKPAKERHTTKSAREAHGRLGIVRPAPNRFRGTFTQWKRRAGPLRVHDSSSFASSSSAVPDCDSASSSSTAFLTIFLWISGWGVIALRMTRRGIASVIGAPAAVAGAAPGAACEPEGVSAGGAARAGWPGPDGTWTAPPPAAPPGGRFNSRLNEPHLWAPLPGTELRVPHVGHGFEPILRISSSSRSQSSNVTKVGCFFHQSWKSRSERSRPSCREAS